MSSVVLQLSFGKEPFWVQRCMSNIRQLATQNGFDYYKDETPGNQGYGEWTSYVYSMEMDSGWTRGGLFSDFKRTNTMSELLKKYDKVIYIDRDYLAVNEPFLHKIAPTTIARFSLYNSTNPDHKPRYPNYHGSFICEDKHKRLLSRYFDMIKGQQKLYGTKVARDGYFGKRIYEQLMRVSPLPSVDVFSLIYSMKESYMGDKLLFLKEVKDPKFKLFHLFESLETYKTNIRFGEENFERVIEDIVRIRYEYFKERILL